MAGSTLHVPCDSSPSSSPDGMPAFLATPPSGPAPGLLIIPAIFGIDPGMQQLASDVARHGAVVLVPDPFWRTDPGVCGFDDAGFQRGIARARSFDVEQGKRDFSAAIAALRARPECNGKVAALGVCFGGRFALFAAAGGEVQCGVTFHGGGLTKHLDLAPSVRCPMSMHFAGEDPSIPGADVDAIRAAFAGHADLRIEVYEGVKHGFTHPTSPAFSATAAARAHGDLLARLAALA